MPAMMNVLIVRTSSMGDLIHTWPAVTDLLAHYPNLRLAWLAEENFADIAALHPGVRAVIPIAWRRWRKSLLSSSTWAEMRVFREQLRARHWDLVLDAQGLVKSALPAKLARAPLAGYGWSSIREPLASLFYDKKHRVSSELSAIERNRRLFGLTFGYQPEGAPDFGIHAGPRPAWLLPGGYTVLLHATSRASKEWPEERWVQLADTLARQDGLVAVLPWGSPAEKERAERLAGKMHAAVVAPKLTLKQAAGLLGHAEAVVGVDTGLTHMANAVNVPLVALYTDTDPAKTGVVEGPRAVNLGNAGQCPAVDEVLAALQRVRSAA
jgi:heptosyltransferase-1